MVARKSVRSAGSQTLPIRGEFTIDHVGELQRALLNHLGKAAEIRLDLSGVTGLDCAGVQLLLAARKTATAAGKPFAITATSAPVRETLQLLRLVPALGLTE